MDIRFIRRRLLNSACIYKSSYECWPGIESNASPVASSSFASTWEEINKQTEHQFGIMRATREQNLPRVAQVKCKVICIIPYLKDHNYLAEAIRSILSQTRRPDSIIVGIDNSGQGDCREIRKVFSSLGADGIRISIRHYPGLNGPYHILNSIVGGLEDDAYVWLHDSDDISHQTRLELQLQFMDHHQLDMCGCFELRFSSLGIELFQYPLNVTRALLIEPGHCMLWPSSLIKVSLWKRLAGCSDKYRFGSDTEFQLRACFVARMGNIPSFLYARRKRENSLTASKHTGHRSWIRGYINSVFKAEYYQRQMIRSSGGTPLLTARFVKSNCGEPGERTVEELTDMSKSSYTQIYSPQGSSS